jgi:hypothetical protein
MLFSESAHHRRRADSQHAGGIADAAAIEPHLDYLLFDLRYPPRVVILQEKDPPLRVRIGAAIALCTIGLLPIFHHLTASTLRTLHCYNRHTSSSFR